MSKLCAGIDVPDGRETFHCTFCGQLIAINLPHIVLPPLPASPNIKNYANLAEMAELSRNYRDAEKYWSKILESDPQNARAWIGKGISAGWQSTIAVPRTAETINYLQKAISLGIPEKAIRERTADEGHSIAVAFYNAAQEHYKDSQTYTSDYSSEIEDFIADALYDYTHNTKWSSEFTICALNSLQLSSMVWNKLDQTNRIANDISKICRQLLKLKTTPRETRVTCQELLAIVTVWENEHDPLRKRRADNIKRWQGTLIKIWRQLGLSLRKRLNWVRSAPRRFDAWLRSSMGEENDIVYRFAQIMLYFLLPIGLIAIVVIQLR